MILVLFPSQTIIDSNELHQFVKPLSITYNFRKLKVGNDYYDDTSVLVLPILNQSLIDKFSNMKSIIGSIEIDNIIRLPVYCKYPNLHIEFETLTVDDKDFEIPHFPIYSKTNFSIVNISPVDIGLTSDSKVLTKYDKFNIDVARYRDQSPAIDLLILKQMSRGKLLLDAIANILIKNVEIPQSSFQVGTSQLIRVSHQALENEIGYPIRDLSKLKLLSIVLVDN